VTPMPDEHEEWSELAVGHALSSLDDADEATYLEHAASCETCRELEREFSETLADLALAAPTVSPPASLKASIMAAISEDESRGAAVIPIDSHRDAVASRARKIPLWIGGVAAAAVTIALVAVFVVAPGHKQASIAARCAAVNCPTITLTGGGQSVAAVMVLDNTAYIDPHGLPATPKGDVYVLWALSSGKSPVGVGALHTVPSSGPVRAGSFTTPIGTVSGFAVTEEQGDAVPATPSEHLLAQGSRV
jgi:Anti-sigma-K factor rskA